ncbi:hypothetical protein FA10DRAFT_252545 [Acaromyces ingoldii]|uniref:Aminoacyl-transfer RNA synthetases class-II family profile domain-containing protein n=1 Tax=Acaromyces ingoldii TaxID=215250 RepID=A0A316YMV3_9BASI|nr:hypothetical protein FA10DRAFT_252545 [Acaromyces ingoldii]PWN90880.1 hypothetical protein FA10DRAFT_252545 [Acaromyces ingoldii]
MLRRAWPRRRLSTTGAPRSWIVLGQACPRPASLVAATLKAGCAHRSTSSSSSSLSRPLSPVAHIASANVGKRVSVAGWLVSLRRISKSLVFAVLLLPSGRGRLQLVAREDQRHVAESWERAGLHGVVHVEGILRSRPQEAQRQGKNPSDQLADLELEASETTVLNAVPSGSLPFDPMDEVAPARDEIRAKHRYLDLRSAKLGHNLRLRSKVAWTVREYLHSQDFTEIETPILLRSTPEGAREYLVPARQASSTITSIAEPRFYALQQSPQQPKQLLIASGVTDRYFQLARCFRDEDGRKDRQPEFTQIDVEMGFVSGCPATAIDGWQIGAVEVREVVEGLVRKIWKVARPDHPLPKHFPVMSYDEAMSRYGSDKPDVRSGLQLYDLTSALDGSAEESAQEQGVDDEADTAIEVLAVTLPTGTLSNKEVQQLAMAVPGVECFKVRREEPNSIASLLLRKSTNVRTYLSSQEIEPTQVDADRLARAVEGAIEAGSTTPPTSPSGEAVTHLFVATRRRPFAGGSTSLGDARLALLSQLRTAAAAATGHLAQEEGDRFVWITHFPLFTRADGDKEHLARGRWSSTHHPFTAPVEADLAALQAVLQRHDGDRERVLKHCKGQHYDLVLNGVEVGGGSVRIHSPHLQRLVLQAALQLSDAETAQFAHLLHALEAGAPPHAGIALGFDRLMAILCGTPTIRDVIAFPKSATGADPLFGSPAALVSEVGAEQVGELEKEGEGGTGAGGQEDTWLSQYGLQRRQRK